MLPLKTKTSFEGASKEEAYVYTIYLLTKVGEGKDQRTFWNRAGVAFGHNRDGSMNFKLDLFPGVTFQIRENKSDADDSAGNHQNHQTNGKENRNAR